MIANRRHKRKPTTNVWMPFYSKRKLLVKHGIKFPIQLKSYIKLLQLETNSRLGINSSSRNKKKREHLPKITLVDDISSPFWMT